VIETIEEFQEQIQKSMLELLQRSPKASDPGETEKRIVEMIMKAWNELSPEDPRRQISIEALPMSKKDKRERRCPRMVISWPRDLMEQMFDPSEFQLSPYINISVTVER
jgi:hypothetical protein